MILAIGLQNIPEGTSVAIPMEAAGFRRVSSSGLRCDERPAARGRARRLPLVEQIDCLLPFSFAFAAGAMLGARSDRIAP